MKKDNYLKSPDLLPVQIHKKNISSFGFIMIWISMAIVLAAFSLGGLGIQQLSLGSVILATAIGSIFLGLLMTLTGDIGIEHGLSFPVYLRAPFGTVGTHIPSIIRGLVAAGWFGINTYFGSTAMNAILYTLTGVDNWFICFIIFAALQIFNTAFGIKAVERFADLSAPVIILISIWMYMTLSKEAVTAGKDIWSWVENPVTGTAAVTAFIVVIMGNMGFWSALAADMPSISRYVKAPSHEKGWFKRNKNAILGNLIAYPITQIFMVSIGAVSYIALGNYDPVVALQETSGGIVLSILLIMIVLAQWSTNTTANLIPAAAIFSNIGGPRFPFWLGVISAGVIGIMMQPWNLFGFISDALLYVGSVISGIVGILISDYYFIRKRRVNVRALYEMDGQYHYGHGINYAGFIAWMLGAIAALLFMDYSFLIGLSISLISYYFLAKYWWFIKYPQAELQDQDDAKYLGISVGNDWVIEMITEPAPERVNTTLEQKSSF